MHARSLGSLVKARPFGMTPVRERRERTGTSGPHEPFDSAQGRLTRASVPPWTVA